MASLVGQPDELRDIRPALLVQTEADLLGLMTQHETQKLTGSDKVGGHRRRLTQVFGGACISASKRLAPAPSSRVSTPATMSV